MITPEVSPAVSEFPTDCVVRYKLPGGRRHLLAVDAHGVTNEERIVFEADDTPDVEADMMAKMRAKPRPAKLWIMPASSAR